MNLHKFANPRISGIGSEGKKKIKKILRHFFKLVACLIFSIGSIGMMETMAGNGEPSNLSGFAVVSGFLFFIGWELFESFNYLINTNPDNSKPRP